MGKVQTLIYDDYAALDDGKRYELIDGELIEMAPAPREEHQWVAGSLHYYLFDRHLKVGDGVAYVAPIDVILEPGVVLQPDNVYVLNDRKHLISDRGIEGGPSIVVEVLSPATESRDRGRKAQLYYQHDVLEYWLIDPATRSVELLVRGESAFTLRSKLDESGTIISDLLPGFELPVARLFER